MSLNSKSNSFDQNFMKLSHIVYYHIIFLMFYKRSYSTMPSGVNDFCPRINASLDVVGSFSLIILITTLRNFVTMFNIKMFSSSLIMVYITLRGMVPF